jgi:hypothetical protein
LDVDELENEMQSVQVSLAQQASSIENLIRDNSASIKTGCSDLQASLTAVNSKTEEFVNGWAKDQPTGSTPLKKEVALPKELPRSRAEEEILAEWRARITSGLDDSNASLRSPLRTSNAFSPRFEASTNMKSVPQLSMEEEDKENTSIRA